MLFTPILSLRTQVEDFWRLYVHLRRPVDERPTVCDYHVFQEGIKPMWEDEANVNGGKWIVRLRKGLAARYWEDILLALLGGQFRVGNEICGCVLSVRYQEDILSVWNRSADSRRVCMQIKETMRTVMGMPVDVVMEYKKHTDSMRDNSSCAHAIERPCCPMATVEPLLVHAPCLRGGRSGLRCQNVEVAHAVVACTLCRPQHQQQLWSGGPATGATGAARAPGPRRPWGAQATAPATPAAMMMPRRAEPHLAPGGRVSGRWGGREVAEMDDGPVPGGSMRCCGARWALQPNAQATARSASQSIRR